MWVNRKAKRHYTIEDTKEVGVVLCGSEVRSIRVKGINLSSVYAIYQSNAFWLRNLDVMPCSYVNAFSVQRTSRPKKLLMHKREIRKWIGLSSRPGYTLVPLKAYFNEKGIFKIQLGLGKGKTTWDKRQSEKEKEDRREEMYGAS